MNFCLCNRNILAIFLLWRRFGRLKDVRREDYLDDQNFEGRVLYGFEGVT